MEYQVLARKWRPKNFDEVIGQDHIVKTLKNSIATNRIAHAYLFAGTRGVGKTTVARIFAKAIRCENLKDGNPCLECSSCLSIESGSDIDYVEIDGASNNGVENIRELIENVHFLPSSGKYKVYVIDEVHMLSTGAFNALLKTLEEPPSHVVFLFATTDPQKLLATVLSRCQRLDFKFVQVGDLIRHIQNIATKEGIRFESEDLIVELCKHGRGSVRDTLSLLDQVLSMTTDKVITDDLFYSSLGLADREVLKTLVSALLLGDVDNVLESYHQIINRNIELKSFVNQMLNSLHLCISEIENPDRLYSTHIVAQNTLDDIAYAEMFWLYEALAKDADWVLKSIDPVNVLEVILRKMTLRREILEAGAQKKKSKPVVKEEPKDWPGFVKFAYQKAPATAANLEQGNILENLNTNSDNVRIRLGFEGDKSQIFLDYLNDKPVHNKVVKLIKEYFELTGNISLDFVSLNEDEKKEKNFLSQAEIRQKEEEDLIKERENRIITNPRIVEAMKIFNTNVDKVILNEAKK